MSEDILSQDEIDALMNGVDEGVVDTEAAPSPPGEAIEFDFKHQERIVRGRMPTLEMINERFMRYFRRSLFSLLRRSPEITAAGIETLKFGDYIKTLYLPSSLNVVRVPPLRGPGLVVLGPTLVFSTVEKYFGGSGRFYTRIEGREFTPIESRVINLLLKDIFDDLTRAWQPVVDVSFEVTSSEMNPHFATIVSPSEIVVVSRFEVDLEGGGGEVHVTLPYSMLEPLRELLEAGVQSDRQERDERWGIALRQEIEEVEVEVSTVLAEAKLTVNDLLHLKEGDIIPIDLPQEIVLDVEGIGSFKGTFGISNGIKAIRCTGPAMQQRQPLQKGELIK